MRPVTKIATGFVFAFGALRLNGFDLLLDPVGWGLCASGLFRLRRSGDGPFAAAWVSAVAMVYVSFAILTVSSGVLGYDRTVSYFAQVISVAGTAGALLTVWLAVEAVIRRIRPAGETATADLLDVLRWAVAGLGALAALAQYGYVGLETAVGIVWFAAVISLIIVLYRSARLRCLSPMWESVADQVRPARHP
ncbi:hypothetical protein GCM10027187_57580 [Streptosporangium sandarakinum]|uniref:Uncharacterized protein n=1 Tax=Streptosporangium sandarakinum TaxID=1260955 RepID=A0A852UT61_9ACTN|nr:hypothetical protein [Streptosporangium sandarakinum]NYF40817.1 hypothetical protein [Streptosporangium sandarakinum]